MKNLLNSLKEYTIIVADTGDFNAMRIFQPRDATTNPSLILKAVQHEDYKYILHDILASQRMASTQTIVDHILVRFGLEILKTVPGRISTEIDARLSFDVSGTVKRAEQIIQMYQATGIPKERVLIKIAATWEGIQAAQQLEQQGIHCNITLLFCLEQAIAAAQANAKLISPFVGRIYDWYKKTMGSAWDESAFSGSNDPGVKSVSEIYHYYKQHGIKTEIMGASFRNIGQITALAGCDLLTISPELLAQLEQNTGLISPTLSTDALRPMEARSIDEKTFRYALNENAMASDKLSEGIRAFVADSIKLDQLIETMRDA